MRMRLPILLVSFCMVVFFGNPFISTAAEEHHGEEGHNRHGDHEAHHSGILNVIGEEAGHIEIRIRGDMMEAWFVGGGNETNRSVPIKTEEIPMKVTLPGRGEKALVLKADPMKLAGEKEGRCSHFIAKADWLKDVEEFEAEGEVVFKGFRQKLVIHYPEGYGPMHGNEEH